MAKKKKRKRKISGLPAIIILMLLLIGVLTAGAVYYLFGNSLRLPGTWEREIDLTNQVRESIASYLSETAYGDEIDIRPYVDKISIKSTLTVTKESEWTEKIDSADYEEITQKANMALKQAVTELLSRRIKDSYIETDVSVGDLVKESTGMSLDAYLSTYGPSMLPSYEELSEKYGVTATYEADREYVTLFMPLSGDMEYTYMTAQGTLVIDGAEGTTVYHKAKEE